MIASCPLTKTILLLTQKVSRRVTSDCKIVAIFTTLSREYLLLNCECRGNILRIINFIVN